MQEGKGTGTVEIPRAQFITSVVTCAYISKNSPIPANRFLELRHASKEETVVDVPFSEIVGSMVM